MEHGVLGESYVAYVFTIDRDRGQYLEFTGLATVIKAKRLHRWKWYRPGIQPQCSIEPRLALQLYHAGITVPGPSCRSHIAIFDVRTEGAPRLASA